MPVSTRPALIREIMTPDPVCVTGAAGLRQLARVFEENEISGAPVIDAEGRLIGVVSKTDLIRRCSEGTPDSPPGYLFELLSEDADEDVEFIPETIIVVEDFMSGDPLTAKPDDPIGRVARRMSEARVHRAVVIDEEKFPIGIVTSLDLLRAFPSC
ncbi:MAG: CBS domain-containing protein [Phycisphaeraceae bacterium]|nr:CBS domain-containing protein [Phycisphaeraceae bacterium]